MKKTLLWLWLLTKRLYKRPTFLILLVLIPALVLGYGAAAGEDSGVVTVALAREDADPLALQVIEKLCSDTQLIRYLSCASADEAESLVRSGKADAAWIFRAGMTDNAARFAQSRSQSDALVDVLEREENVALRLAREKLSGVLYICCARALYILYIRQNVPGLDHLSDDALWESYRGTQVGDTLFTYDTARTDAVQVSYLLSPVRGLLAVVTVLSAAAGAMYHMEDRRRGTFGWVSQKKLPLTELGCQVVCTGNVAVVVSLALTVSGLTGPVLTELAAMVLYILCTAVFGMLLRQLCGSMGVLAAVLPVLAVVMLVVCPVFFDLGALRQVQYLFPPTYYINAAVNPAWLGLMAAYTAVALGLYCLIGKCKLLYAQRA